MPLGTQVGLGPGLPHCVRWRPSSPQKGACPQFSANVYCGQTVAHLSSQLLLSTCTTEQSTLTHKGRIATADGPFSCVHQRYLANTTELVLSSAHLSLQHKQQIDQFSSFCTAHDRKSLYFTIGALAPKLILPMEDLNPHLIYGSLDLSEPTTQTTLRSVQLFCTNDRRVSLYVAMGCPFTCGDLDPI